jgi:hypothetical protein
LARCSGTAGGALLTLRRAAAERSLKFREVQPLSRLAAGRLLLLARLRLRALLLDTLLRLRAPAG